MSGSGKTPKQLAMELMKAQTLLAAALTETVSIVGGTMLQLRSHERAVEQHDDIVAVIKSEVLEIVEAALDRIIGYVESSTTAYDDNNGIVKMIDDMWDVSYSDGFKAVAEKYKPAFAHALAHRVLTDMGEYFTYAFDQVVKAAVATGVMAGYAKANGVISNDSVWEVVAEVITTIRKQFSEQVTEIFDKADTELDDIAKKENAFFEHLLDEGYDASEAVGMVEQRFADRISARLGGTDNG